MSQFEPPTADNALLGFMLSVLAAVGCLGFFLYWLLQPSVLVNAGVEGYASKRAGADILTVVATDIETSAIALALRENERQGIRPVALAAAEPSAAPAPVAKVSVKKRVVRRERWDDDWSSHRRDDWSSNRRSGWGSDNFGRRSSGGFGDWFR
jgi:hypothetical protein